MQSLPTMNVLRQLVTERESQLLQLRASMTDPRRVSLRRRIGEQLVLLGARIAAEPTLRPARFRS